MVWANILLLLFSAKTCAAAQVPTEDELTAVRIFLSTSSVEQLERYTSSETVEGEPILSEAPVHLMDFSSTVVDGYTRRYSFDPAVITSTATHADLVAGTRGEFAFEFYEESQLTEIKYPRRALVDSRLNTIHIPIALVVKIERRKGRFDRHDVYGEPFFMEEERRVLLQKPPHVSCVAKYEPERTAFWVSYNDRITREDMAPVCDSDKPVDINKMKDYKWAKDVVLVYYPTHH